jgi:acyl-CoA synthetase (AMP-forming)/AMP-acid ligase II
VLDSDGYLTITDRRKDIIIRGGENLSSKQIEDVLAERDAVADVAVVAAPDPVYGQRACAFVVPRHTATLSLADIRTHFAAAGAALSEARQRFGRLDVIVNNAGYANLSPIETGDDADFRAQFETNFWGVYNVSKAAIPPTRRPNSRSTGSAACCGPRPRRSASR